MTDTTRTPSATEPPVLQPTTRLAGLRPYRPPVVPPHVDLRLDANEGPTPPDPTLSAISSTEGSAARAYPSARDLEHALAARIGVDPDEVVATCGGDDAIDRLCRATIEPGRELLLHAPTFEMIERGGRLAGGTIRGVPWMDGPFPIAAMLDAIGPATGMVALVSPNNPTGGLIPRDAIDAIATRAREFAAVVLLDQAYIEFAGGEPGPSPSPNLVRVRTFSKARGLAGMRVGYAVAPEPIATWLRTAGGPFPVSAAGLRAALASLDHGDAQHAWIERVRRERSELAALVARLGGVAFESHANFVLCRFADAARTHAGLLERGISVRRFDGRPGLHDCLRITLPGEPASFERLRDALGAIPGATP
ncbi:MAG: histidinol-phosphate transaminase [Planctomycetota bacterium]